MIVSPGNSPDEVDKKAFVSDIEAKLLEKQDRLSFIKHKVRHASESQRIEVSEQLLRAEQHADSSVEALRAQLELLQNANDDSWPARRFEVEVAWDELSQAIKKVVARFP